MKINNNDPGFGFIVSIEERFAKLEQDITNLKDNVTELNIKVVK